MRCSTVGSVVPLATRATRRIDETKRHSHVARSRNESCPPCVILGRFCDRDVVGPVTTDVVALLGRGPCFRAPVETRFSGPACRRAAPARRCVPRRLLSYRRRRPRRQRRRSRIFDPEADQVTRQAVSTGKAVERLDSQVILRHLALELDAVAAVSGHWLSSFEIPASRSIPSRHTVLSASRGALQMAGGPPPARLASTDQDYRLR